MTEYRGKLKPAQRRALEENAEISRLEREGRISTRTSCDVRGYDLTRKVLENPAYRNGDLFKILEQKGIITEEWGTKGLVPRYKFAGRT